MSVAAFLRNWLYEHPMTHKGLARILEYNPGNLHRLLNDDHRTVTAITACRMANRLGCTVEELVGYEPDSQHGWVEKRLYKRELMDEGETNPTVATFLRHWLHLHSMSVYRLAMIVDCDRGDLHRLIHRDAKGLSATTACRIADRLGCTVEELMGYDGEADRDRWGIRD